MCSLPFTSVTETSSYYNTALLLGLLPGDPVISWAETHIERHESVPSPFFDIVSTPAWDITTLRYALQALCGDSLSPMVLQSIFRLIQKQYADNNRSFDDTMRVLSQLRYFLKLEKTLADKINMFETEYESAVHNGTVTSIEPKIAGWLKEVSDGADDPAQQ